VVAERTGHEHAVAGLRARGRQIDTCRNCADPGGVDEQAVGAPALDDLGVAGDDGHAGSLRRRRHRGGDSSEVADREAFLDHEAGRKPTRLGSCDRQVVDGAVHGERADVAPREKERLDYVGVGRERKPGAGRLADGRVAELCQQRVVKLLDEELLDESARRPAAGAVGKRDDLVAELRHAARSAVTPPGGRSCSRRRRRLRSRPCTFRAGAPACRPSRTPCTPRA
jgi:hypothetical protein